MHGCMHTLHATAAPAPADARRFGADGGWHLSRLLGNAAMKGHAALRALLGSAVPEHPHSLTLQSCVPYSQVHSRGDVLERWSAQVVHQIISLLHQEGCCSSGSPPPSSDQTPHAFGGGSGGGGHAGGSSRSGGVAAALSCQCLAIVWAWWSRRTSHICPMCLCGFIVRNSTFDGQSLCTCVRVAPSGRACRLRRPAKTPLHCALLLCVPSLDPLLLGCWALDIQIKQVSGHRETQDAASAGRVLTCMPFSNVLYACTPLVSNVGSWADTAGAQLVARQHAALGSIRRRRCIWLRRLLVCMSIAPPPPRSVLWRCVPAKAPKRHASREHGWPQPKHRPLPGGLTQRPLPVRSSLCLPANCRGAQVRARGSRRGSKGGVLQPGWRRRPLLPASARVPPADSGSCHPHAGLAPWCTTRCCWPCCPPLPALRRRMRSRCAALRCGRRRQRLSRGRRCRSRAAPCSPAPTRRLCCAAA